MINNYQKFLEKKKVKDFGERTGAKVKRIVTGDHVGFDPKEGAKYPLTFLPEKKFNELVELWKSGKKNGAAEFLRTLIIKERDTQFKIGASLIMLGSTMVKAGVNNLHKPETTDVDVKEVESTKKENIPDEKETGSDIEKSKDLTSSDGKHSYEDMKEMHPNSVKNRSIEHFTKDVNGSEDRLSQLSELEKIASDKNGAIGYAKSKKMEVAIDKARIAAQGEFVKSHSTWEIYGNKVTSYFNGKLSGFDAIAKPSVWKDANGYYHAIGVYKGEIIK